MDAPTQPGVVERRAATLLATTQRALWPLVKLLLHRGIAYPALTEALKSAFVRVALREFPLQGKRDTDSRISLLTGIHRRDVKRLREASRSPAVPSRSAAAGVAGGQRGAVDPQADGTSFAARVLAIWTGSPEYLDADGEPRPLPRLARGADEQSFEALVRTVSKDIRPRALLDEWLRRGTISLDAQDRVCLHVGALMAQRDLDERAFYYGQNLHDHLAAIAHNLTGAQPPLPEQCVFHARLSAEAIAELAELARDEAARALAVVERRALELAARDARASEPRGRINFGMYFYGSPGRPAASAAPAADKPDA